MPTNFDNSRQWSTMLYKCRQWAVGCIVYLHYQSNDSGQMINESYRPEGNLIYQITDYHYKSKIINHKSKNYGKICKVFCDS